MTRSDFSHSSENAAPVPGVSKALLSQLSVDSEIWQNLKQAIAASSGFQRWRIERDVDNGLTGLTQDNLVRRYLRETLETLAY